MPVLPGHPSALAASAVADLEAPCCTHCGSARHIFWLFGEHRIDQPCWAINTPRAGPGARAADDGGRRQASPSGTGPCGLHQLPSFPRSRPSPHPGFPSNQGPPCARRGRAVLSLRFVAPGRLHLLLKDAHRREGIDPRVPGSQRPFPQLSPVPSFSQSLCLSLSRSGRQAQGPAAGRCGSGGVCFLDGRGAAICLAPGTPASTAARGQAPHEVRAGFCYPNLRNGGGEVSPRSKTEVLWAGRGGWGGG